MTDKMNEGPEVKNYLIRNLRDLKIKQKIGKSLFHHKINGFYKCPKCPFKNKIIHILKAHLAAVHLKIKNWNCSNCTKSKILNSHHFPF